MMDRAAQVRRMPKCPKSYETMFGEGTLALSALTLTRLAFRTPFGIPSQ